MDIQVLLQRLNEQHPNAVCELDYGTPYQLLVAVILSAQCTDRRVNMVTPALFAWGDNPKDMAEKSEEELIPYIRSCGFYRNKAKSIIASARSIMARFGGEVPRTVEELVTLEGVGRKTANVVYSVAFGGDAIPVDTHVFRLAHRLGLSQAKTPDGVEKDLNARFEREEWSRLHHLLIHHGRYVCNARNPRCNECSLADICPSKEK
ncbi:MAG: endonuclease III [Clostridia bacterium]|nr:endonuclease III [Clostridia bacterium]